MKKGFALTGVALAILFLIGTIAFAEPNGGPIAELFERIFDLETRVDSLESSQGSGSGLQRMVYEGDPEEAPQIFEPDNGGAGGGQSSAVIEIPELDLSDMPGIDVFAAVPEDIYNEPGSLKWQEVPGAVPFHHIGGSYHGDNAYTLEDGRIILSYKTENCDFVEYDPDLEPPEEPEIDCDEFKFFYGYKIVVIK